MNSHTGVSTLELIEALRCARYDHRHEIVEVLGSLPSPDGGAALEHKWLWAERLYRLSDYVGARREFGQFNAETESRLMPRWMVAIARLRCAYAAFRLGASDAAQSDLRAANRLLAEDVKLRFLRPDAAAMGAHLLELEGGIELARACFVSAHQLALEEDRPGRAATTASDVGRLHADRGQLAEALQWQHAALAILKTSPDEFIDRVVQTRLARIEIAMRQEDRARERLHHARERCNDQLTPEVTISILTALTDLACATEDPSRALQSGVAFLDEARSIAERHALSPLKARVARESAYLHAQVGPSRSRRDNASSHFCEAVRLALELSPTPGLKLQHLAEDLLRYRSVVLPQRYGNGTPYLLRVEAAARAFKIAQRAGVRDYRHRRDKRTSARLELLEVIREVILEDAVVDNLEIVLGEHRYVITDRNVEVYRGDRKVDDHAFYVGRVLRCLRASNRPLSALEISRKAFVGEGSVGQALKFIRRHSRGAVVKTQERPVRYALSRTASEKQEDNES